MRTSLLVAASALALLATPAVAQTTPRSTGAGTAPPAAAPQPAPKADPLKQEDVSQIKGAAAYGGDGKKQAGECFTAVAGRLRHIHRIFEIWAGQVVHSILSTEIMGVYVLNKITLNIDR